MKQPDETDYAAHADEMNEVKRQINVAPENKELDGWIYNYLENKYFDIGETVAKFERRATMEQNELAPTQMAPEVINDLRKGIIQIIGSDKEDRITFYINTHLDHPTAQMREERRKSFDMWMSYATRLRRNNKKCRITMLINQDKASVFKNVDMTFQSTIALRVSKYWPQSVDRMYICNMGRTLSAFAKPIFARLPAAISQRIFVITDGEIKGGKLKTLFDDSVLPKDLGGKNDCNNLASYNRFISNIETYWRGARAAMLAGRSLKDWEIERLKDEDWLKDEAADLEKSKQRGVESAASTPATPTSQGGPAAADGSNMTPITDESAHDPSVGSNTSQSSNDGMSEEELAAAEEAAQREAEEVLRRGEEEEARIKAAEKEKETQANETAAEEGGSQKQGENEAEKKEEQGEKEGGKKEENSSSSSSSDDRRPSTEEKNDEFQECEDEDEA